jgi:hypothetical protein
VLQFKGIKRPRSLRMQAKSELDVALPSAQYSRRTAAMRSEKRNPIADVPI